MSNTQPKPMFFVKDPSNGAIQGPMSKSQLKSWYEQGGMHAWQIAKTRNGPWTTAGTVKGLANTPIPTSKPALPPENHSDGIAELNPQPQTFYWSTEAATGSSTSIPGPLSTNFNRKRKENTFPATESVFLLGVLVGFAAGCAASFNNHFRSQIMAIARTLVTKDQAAAIGISDSTPPKKTERQLEEEFIVAAFERGIRSQLKDPASFGWTDGKPIITRFFATQGDVDFWELSKGEYAILVVGDVTATNSYGGRIAETFYAIYRGDRTELMHPIVMNQLVKTSVAAGKDLNKTIITDFDRQIQGQKESP